MQHTYLVDVCDEDKDRYRFGFNGQEKVNEIAGVGNFIDYIERGQDTRIARFISRDPLTSYIPRYSPYQFAGNTPIQAIDLDGAELYKVNSAKDKDGKITSISITTIYEIGNSVKDNMQFTLNGVSQEYKKIASFGVRNGDKTEFRNNFTRLEQLVSDNGTTTETKSKVLYFESKDGAIKSKDYRGKEVKVVTQMLEFKNGIEFWTQTNEELNVALKNFKAPGYKLMDAKDEFSMYNIATQAKYKDKIYAELKKLKIEDDQINWLPYLPSDGSGGTMRSSVGTIKKNSQNDKTEKKKTSGPSGQAVHGR